MGILNSKKNIYLMDKFVTLGIDNMNVFEENFGYELWKHLDDNSNNVMAKRVNALYTEMPSDVDDKMILFKNLREIRTGYKVIEFQDFHKLTDHDKLMYEYLGYECKPVRSTTQGTATSLDSVMRNKRRQKQKAFNYAIANEWKYFVTFTLDKSKIDRYDLSVIMLEMRKANKHLKRKYKNYKCLLFPEQHPNGELDEYGNKAWHFHGLIFGIPKSELSMTDKATNKGQKIYNLDYMSNKFGFNTLIELDEHKERVANYITKYIVKAIDVYKGNEIKTFYIVSRGLNLLDTEKLLIDYDKYITEHNDDIKFMIPKYETETIESHCELDTRYIHTRTINVKIDNEYTGCVLRLPKIENLPF